MKHQLKLNTSASAAPEGGLDGGLLPFCPSARVLKCCREKSMFIQRSDSHCSEHTCWPHRLCVSCVLGSQPKEMHSGWCWPVEQNGTSAQSTAQLPESGRGTGRGTAKNTLSGAHQPFAHCHCHHCHHKAKCEGTSCAVLLAA